MGIFKLFQNLKGNIKTKSTLNEDIIKGYEWISKALNSSGYKADFSIDSLKEIDRFFDENTNDGQVLPKGLLAQDMGNRIFAIGSYVGEVIRRKYDGKWIADDNDIQGEINISVQLSKGTIIFPVQRVMKRLKNGVEDGIYIYGVSQEE